MTVYYAERYTVGGLYTHGGDEETHHDPMPANLTKVWEIDPADPNDTTPWVRDADNLWTVQGEGDEGFALSWIELLDEFGPLTDDERDAAMGIEALDDRNRADWYAKMLA